MQEATPADMPATMRPNRAFPTPVLSTRNTLEDRFALDRAISEEVCAGEIRQRRPRQ
jgi:hypothetical protein